MSYGSEVDVINRIKAKVEDGFDVSSQAHKVKIVEGNVTLNAGDIEIGAVEIKDATTDNRVAVNSDGTLNVKISDTVTVSSTDLDIRNLDSSTDNVLVYGFDGTNNVKLHVDSSGDLQVDILSIPTVTVEDGGSSLTTDTDQLPSSLSALGNLKVSLEEDNTGTKDVNVTNASLTVDGTVDIGNMVVVTSTDLDIRDLSSSTDSISVYQAGTWSNVGVSIDTDNVGLAKSTDISTDQPRHLTNAYDSVNDRFKVDAEVVANPSNIDVALSTRASESTLSNLDGKVTKCDTDNVSVVNFPSDYPDSLAESRIASLLKLFNESYSFSYNTDGTISQIVMDTKDADGNSKTVTFSFSYDANGNLTSVSKTVS